MANGVTAKLHNFAYASIIFQAICIKVQDYYNFINKTKSPSMHALRNTNTLNSTHTPLLVLPKQCSHSVSTEESPRSAPVNKEKSQLCKRFIEDGCCPYQQRCKFAHGLHQLKKNQQQNSKYKTKSCGTFLQLGCCLFGNRCNFIHAPTPKTLQAPDRQLDPQMLQIRKSGTNHSRLMKLLEPAQ